MRLKYLWTGLCLLAALSVRAAGQAEEIVAHYHFAGCHDLAANTNFNNLGKVFAAPQSKEFVDLVLDRLTGSIAKSLGLKPDFEADPLLRPLLDDLVSAESVASFGGPESKPWGFVMAVRLDGRRAALWQENIGKEFKSVGTTFQVEGAQGMRWTRDAFSLWIVRANGWLVAGSGDALTQLRNEYLREIKDHGRPGAPLRENWLEADIDWPRLSPRLPELSLPLKPARTKLNLAMRQENIRVAMQVIYPENIAWHGHPWRIPTNTIFDPLLSFTATEDIDPFLKPIPQKFHTAGYPFTDQFYVWALSEMPFQTYTAWPVHDASNVVERLGKEAPDLLNPVLQTLNSSKISWLEKPKQLVWVGNPMLGPNLGVAPAEHGEFLLAGLFPLTTEKTKPPEALWDQFKNRTDLVYYDWEIAGARLQQWRLLSQLLPMLPAAPLEPGFSKSLTTGKLRQTPSVIEEGFLASLSQMLGLADTITEIKYASPNQLTLVRRSPLGLTGIETVVLSHWLTGAGPGPVDMGLLPPRAKMTGPGMHH
jgi:hypothetical protein